VVSFGLRGFGFAPRQFGRSTSRGKIGTGIFMSILNLKRLHFFILTALLTFAVGVTVAWL
jgi:hypothetical protein